MKRREFVTLLLGTAATCCAFSRPVTAQQAVARRRVGILLPTTSSDAVYHQRLNVLRQTLRDIGWIDGQNIVLEAHHIDGSMERAAELAREMVRTKVDIIVTQGAVPLNAARAATTSIPIVMAEIGDAVGSGVVASLARPGGNITGSTLVSTLQSTKRLELAKEIYPTLARIAVIWSEEASSHHLQLKEMQSVAPSLGVELKSISLNRSSDVDARLQNVLVGNSQAIMTLDDPLVQSRRAAIISFGMKHKLPVMGEFRASTQAGALVSYGPDQLEHWRRVSVYIDKIFKGEKPADLPVQQPSKFDLVINLKTATALGFAVPPMMLTRADDVIE